MWVTVSLLVGVQAVMMCRQLITQGYANGNLCSNYNTTTAMINVFICPDSKSCKAADIGTAQQQGSFTTYCLDYVSPFDYGLTIEQRGQATGVACSKKPGTYDELAIGSHPKFCMDSSECTYKNGPGTCVCGVDGLSYCAVKSTDVLWNNYFSAACYGDYNEMLYWQAYINAVPYVTSANSYHYKYVRELVDLAEARAHRTNSGSAGAINGCPLLTCGFIDYDQCSFFNGTHYNVYPSCRNEQVCMATGVLSAILQGYSRTKCSDLSLAVPVGDTAEAVLFTYCAATPRSDTEKQERLSTSHPKKCTSNADCTLANGNNGQCSCSLSGTKFCELNAADPELDLLYSSACNGDINATQLYYVYKSLYVILQDYPSCAPSVFVDMQLYLNSTLVSLAGYLVPMLAGLLL